jgi:hypothetical protein
MLRDVQHLSAGTNGHQPGRGFRRVARHILEFKRDDANPRSELTNLVKIVVSCAELAVSDLARRRVVVRRIDMNAVAEFPRRQGEHSAKLAAAKDTDGGAGKNRGAKLVWHEARRRYRPWGGWGKAKRSGLGGDTRFAPPKPALARLHSEAKNCLGSRIRAPIG